MRGGILRFWIVMGFFAAALCGPTPALAKEQTVYHVPPNKIASYIAKKKGRKKAVVVWASWCPFCRKNMPAYVRQEKRIPGSMILISVDQDLEQLRDYLERTDLAPIKIIISQRTPGQSFNKALSRLGIAPVKSYPTTILLDEDNRVIQQSTGTPEEIAAFLGSDAPE